MSTIRFQTNVCMISVRRGLSQGSACSRRGVAPLCAGDNRAVKRILVVSLLAFSLEARAQASDGIGLPAQLEAQADRIAQLMAGVYAVEYRTARRYHFVDVNADGVPDPVVFFAIEGLGASKRYDFYLAVFRTEPLAPSGLRLRPPGYRLLDFMRLGGRGERQVDFEKLSFAGGVFSLEALEAGANEPARRTRVLLRLHDDGRLTEVKP